MIEDADISHRDDKGIFDDYGRQPLSDAIMNANSDNPRSVSRNLAILYCDCLGDLVVQRWKDQPRDHLGRSGQYDGEGEYWVQKRGALEESK